MVHDCLDAMTGPEFAVVEVGSTANEMAKMIYPEA